MFIKNNTQYLSATSGRSNQSQHGLRVASECVYSSVQQGGNRLQHIQKHRDIKGTGHKIKIMKIQSESPRSPQNVSGASQWNRLKQLRLYLKQRNNQRIISWLHTLYNIWALKWCKKCIFKSNVTSWCSQRLGSHRTDCTVHILNATGQMWEQLIMFMFLF